MGVIHAGSVAAPLKERGDDLYETPQVAVEALLREEALPTCVWEPACGPGAIVRVLRAHGHTVYATDLVNYDSPDQDASVWDFLMENQLPIGVAGIVTNPPFKLAALFAEHALRLGCPLVIMLLRLAFLEAGNMDSEASKARRKVLDGGQLSRVLLFRKRLPMMHRHGWDGPKTGSGIAFAWFVWELDHSGPAELRRISWGD